MYRKHCKMQASQLQKAGFREQEGTENGGAGGGGLAGRVGGLRTDGCAHCLKCDAGLVGLNVDHIKLMYLIMCGLLCINYTPNKAGLFLTYVGV